MITLEVILGESVVHARSVMGGVHQLTQSNVPSISMFMTNILLIISCLVSLPMIIRLDSIRRLLGGV